MAKKSKTPRLRTLIAKIPSTPDVASISGIAESLKRLERFSGKGASYDVSVYLVKEEPGENSNEILTPVVKQLRSGLPKGTVIKISDAGYQIGAVGAKSPSVSATIAPEIGIRIRMDVPRREAAPLERYFAKEKLGTVTRIYNASLPGDSGTVPYRKPKPRPKPRPK